LAYDAESEGALKYVVFAVLVLIPLLLVGWVVREGRSVPPTAPLASAEFSTAGTASALARPDPDDAPLLALFEGTPGGVKAKGMPALYDEKRLFDYIDGAAPLYIDRHFRKLAAVEMATAEGADLTCDVYDMREPENAASIFLSEKSASSRTVDDWPQALTGPMSFVFRKSRYYVKLTAFDKKSEAALPGLALALRERMQ
jgi:hypothetical protein